MTIWDVRATCPICGNTRCTKDIHEDGDVTIHCPNKQCASKGGPDATALLQSLAARSERNTRQFSVQANGTSGIEIRTKLNHDDDDVERAVFISPWFQFEPAERQDERLQIAYDIVHRIVTYPELIKNVATLQKLVDEMRDQEDTERERQQVIFNMWREERVKQGLPDDFSDIKVWPEILLRR